MTDATRSEAQSGSTPFLLTSFVGREREAERPTEGLGRHGLTPREYEVLRMLVVGKSNPEIADALFISPRTATTHVANILGKLSVASCTEAVTRAEGGVTWGGSVNGVVPHTARVSG